MDQHRAEPHDGCRRARAQPGGLARTLPRPVRAVVFDLDGTLLDTETLYRAAFHAALAAFGRSLPDAGYQSLIGLPGPARREMLPGLLGQDFPVAAFFDLYARQRHAALQNGVPLKPGVQEALDLLERAGIPYAIATSASARTARANLAAAGLAHRIEALVTRDHVAHGKPHPECFIQAACHLGQPPEDCLAIEDSPPGIAASCSAGMMVACIPDAMPPTPAMLACCDARLDSLHGLRALLWPAAGKTAPATDRCPLRV